MVPNRRRFVSWSARLGLLVATAKTRRHWANRGIDPWLPRDTRFPLAENLCKAPTVVREAAAVASSNGSGGWPSQITVVVDERKNNPGGGRDLLVSAFVLAHFISRPPPHQQPVLDSTRLEPPHQATGPGIA
ncbi:hypothetical protein ASPZODRAFT_11754 [Penicilliopsis zonata CBS 506.65]|uniref:Uncharacterized protein n=1 Tax=Penicilliopsis zonata CBS 506.65 TaxID=1073090 RepID=A0A1L9SUL6_9EURO|nr:hypothetical protein ASPZODRAFT_11754 [Penicilliopsis zonata CBS 506.65]OJJ50915.1 hypothetical protein ASPZODRAFT_11754 [Penicilliopsis zonata CBS 506.65]